jgi:hypothetical protein
MSAFTMAPFWKLGNSQIAFQYHVIHIHYYLGVEKNRCTLAGVKTAGLPTGTRFLHTRGRMAGQTARMPT